MAGSGRRGAARPASGPHWGEWTRQWRRGVAEFNGDINVLGGEACLWSELVTPQLLPARLWSRLPAVAERLWSAADCTDVEDFYTRLQACWLCLPEDPELAARRNLEAMGLNLDQIKVICLLEPVKWYGRLLGQQALEARIAGSEMPKARPYNLETPLNRVVDMLPPESIAARRLDELGLVVSANRVRELLAPLRDQQVPKIGIAPTRPWSWCWISLLCQRRSEQGRNPTGLDGLDRPYGEYMVAPLYAGAGLCSRKRTRGQAGMVSMNDGASPQAAPASATAATKQMTTDALDAAKTAAQAVDAAELEPLGQGHIHQTYLTDASQPDRSYVLQQINAVVYQDIDLLDAQTRLVLGALANDFGYVGQYQVPELIPTSTKSLSRPLRAGLTCWRMWRYVEGSATYDPPQNRRKFSSQPKLWCLPAGAKL